MKRLLYMATLLMAASLIFAPTAVAQDLYDCGDFNGDQAAAQAIYDADPSDPYGLDGPIGEASDGIPGVACEGLGVGSAPPPAIEEQPKAEVKTEVETKTEVKAEEQPKAEAKAEEKKAKTEAKKEEKGKEEKKEEKKKEMPKTGGPAFGSLVGLGAGVLLVGGGLIALKRRNS